MASTRNEKIRIFQRKLYLTSKQKGGYRFYSLYDKVYRKDILIEAYQQCKANKGRPGVDGQTFEDIERQGIESWIEVIAEELRKKEYQPQPVLRVKIPKAGGGERPLGIPGIRDRVVQVACKIVIEPIFEAHLNRNSYGYRPKKRAADAINEIERLIKAGYVYIYDADLKGYFDSIPQQKLMEKVGRRISDKNLLALIQKFLRAAVKDRDEEGKVRLTKPTQGTPQGGVISPLLANIYLNDFMELINTQTPCKMISYADDFVILHKKLFTKEQAGWVKKKLESEGLTINDEKTQIVDLSKQRAEFDFLGFNFKRVPCFYRKGIWYLKIQPSRKSQKKFKETIRGIVKHRTSVTLEELIGRVNLVIRGWRNYFRQCGYPRKVFFKMDWFVVGRFYRWARRLSQRSSKCLTPDALKILLDNGLEFFVATATLSAKGVR